MLAQTFHQTWKTDIFCEQSLTVSISWQTQRFMTKQQQKRNEAQIFSTKASVLSELATKRLASMLRHIKPYTAKMVSKLIGLFLSRNI